MLTEAPVNQEDNLEIDSQQISEVGSFSYMLEM